MKSSFLVFTASACFTFLYAEDPHRIYAHLEIGDLSSAVEEAKIKVQEFPDSKEFHCALMTALAAKGEEVEALLHFRKIVEKYPEECQNRALIESLAWGVIRQAERSKQINIRYNSLIGAASTRDAKAVPMIIEQLRDTNALIRSVAVQLSAMYGDLPIQHEIERMLKEEKVWYVRLEVIKAIGRLGLTHLKPKLEKILSDSKTIAEERTATIMALLQMYGKNCQQEVSRLIHSPRQGLRQLGCELIARLKLEDYFPTLWKALDDTSYYVALSALNGIGQLYDEYTESELNKFAEISEKAPPPLAVSAARLLLLQKDPRGKKLLETYLNSNDKTIAHMAAGAIACSGIMGKAIAEKYFQSHPDLYIRLNLAWGLIGCESHIKEACSIINQSLESNELWMWENTPFPFYRQIAPSRLRHVDAIANYPNVVDQITRLEVLGVLSANRYPGAQNKVKKFLNSRHWGVTATAAANLLIEGDEQAAQGVVDLIDDEDEKIRLQAALILAMMGNDLRALPVLKDAYPKVDREMKGFILQALANISDEESIPFLISQFEEPFQSLRVGAASALLQSIYH